MLTGKSGCMWSRWLVAGKGYLWSYQPTLPSHPCRKHGRASTDQESLVPGSLPGLLSSKLAQGPALLEATALYKQDLPSSSPRAVGATQVGASFPSLPFPLVGAFQPFATSIPPVLDRGWGQHQPDSSCLPATCSHP